MSVTKVSQLKGNPNPVDPHVVVPAAVRRAAEAADAAQRAAYPEQTADATPPGVPPTNPDTIQIAPPSATPPAEPSAQPHTPEAPAPSATPPVTPPGNDTGTVEEWAQRFRSSEGRRRQLENALATTNDRIAMLENELNDLRNRPAPQAPTPQQRLVTEQEEQEMGTEMLDIVGRRATEVISPALAELRAMMGTIQDQVRGATTAATRSARENMLTSLDSQLPEWREINMRDEFKAWLALPDPFFGVSRHGALTKAFEQNDTARVLNFFKGFVSELAATIPADPPVPPALAPAKTTLGDMAAPGRARTSAQPNAPAEKQIITTDDIDAFYAAKRKGLYAGREAEFAQLEQELFQAQQEGRVRQSPKR